MFSEKRGESGKEGERGEWKRGKWTDRESFDPIKAYQVMS